MEDFVLYTHSAPVLTSRMTATSWERVASSSTTTLIALNLESGKVRVKMAMLSLSDFNFQSSWVRPASGKSPERIRVNKRVLVFIFVLLVSKFFYAIFNSNTV